MNSVEYFRKFKRNWIDRNDITDSSENAILRSTKRARQQNNTKKARERYAHKVTPITRDVWAAKRYPTNMVWAIKTFS